MAAVQRKLVHKQFNSPIGLYSDQNVKETLDRELRAFSNGSVGIEINDPRRPANLAFSSVLKMVEEEDEKMHPGYKRVAWPPADSISPQSGAHNQQPSYQNQYEPQTTQAFQPVSHQPSSQQSYQPQQQSYQQQPNYQNSHQPQSYQQSQPQQQYYSQGYQQPEAQQQQQQQPQYRDQSPGVITLRKSAPISQKPAPVFTSQPAAAKYMGGANMRGDLKWPPQEYKDQAAAENEARRKLALGPAFRPRRVHKDYTQFFAKNALNSYYPGYKVPPGTQHVEANY